LEEIVKRLSERSIKNVTTLGAMALSKA